MQTVAGCNISSKFICVGFGIYCFQISRYNLFKNVVCDMSRPLFIFPVLFGKLSDILCVRAYVCLWFCRFLRLYQWLSVSVSAFVSFSVFVKVCVCVCVCMCRSLTLFWFCYCVYNHLCSISLPSRSQSVYTIFSTIQTQHMQFQIIRVNSNGGLLNTYRHCVQFSLSQ